MAAHRLADEIGMDRCAKGNNEAVRIDPAYDVFFGHKIDFSARDAGRVAPNAIGLFLISKVR